MGVTIEDRYFTKWLSVNKVMKQNACLRCFLMEDKVLNMCSTFGFVDLCSYVGNVWSITTRT